MCFITTELPTEQMGKSRKELCGSRKIKDTTTGVNWKPPIMWMASPVKRGKGEKQAETAYEGQEISSHLKTIKQQQYTERHHLNAGLTKRKELIACM